MDPAWALSLGMLIVAIGTGVFAVRASIRQRRPNGNHGGLSPQERIHRMEERISSLEQEKERLVDDLRLCERERIRLMEMLFSHRSE